MGRKYPRKRKHFFLHITGWIILLLVGTGCAPYYTPYDEAQVVFHQYSEANHLLLQAESSFANGNFLKSIKKNQEILNRFPQKYGDHALYMMGQIYTSPEFIYINYNISIHFFKKLIKEYPKSSFIKKATIWIWLLNQNMEYAKKIDHKNKRIAVLEKKLRAEKKESINLQNQIKRLKEIDLGIDKKKREALPAIGQ